jgi:hypothetical protein
MMPVPAVRDSESVRLDCLDGFTVPFTSSDSDILYKFVQPPAFKFQVGSESHWQAGGPSSWFPAVAVVTRTRTEPVGPESVMSWPSATLPPAVPRDCQAVWPGSYSESDRNLNF